MFLLKKYDLRCQTQSTCVCKNTSEIGNPPSNVLTTDKFILI